MGIEESSSAIAASTATSPAADASSKELIGNTKHASGTGGLMSPAQEITDLAPELEEEPVLVDGTASPLFLSYVEVDTDSDSEDEGEFSDEEDYDTEEETDEGEFLSCCRISPPRVPERDRSNSAAGDEGFSQKLRVFIVKVPSPANERATYFMLYLCGPAGVPRHEFSSILPTPQLSHQKCLPRPIRLSLSSPQTSTSSSPSAVRFFPTRAPCVTSPSPSSTLSFPSSPATPHL